MNKPFPIIHKKKVKFNLPLGVHEGVSKCLSNVLAYGIDSRKTLFQHHGYIPKLPHKVLVKRWTSGLSSSCLLIGGIYYIYYSIYNRLREVTPFAGTLSALTTSTIKLPIYNSMKLLQSNIAESIIEGGYKLHNTNGLYSGYKVSLLEDIVELDVKNRLYNKFKKENSRVFNVFIGTISSAFASALTTPFDNIRLQLCTGMGKNNLIFKNLFRGVGMRIQSNMVKNVGFYFIFEMLKKYI